MDGFDQTDALMGSASPRTRVFCHFPHGDAPRDAVMDGFYAGSARPETKRFVDAYQRKYGREARPSVLEASAYDAARMARAAHGKARTPSRAAARSSDPVGARTEEDRAFSVRAASVAISRARIAS